MIHETEAAGDDPMPPTSTCAHSRLIHDYTLNEPIELDDPDLSNK